jgi:glycosyltransferase involved in cell wall biosynthesis
MAANPLISTIIPVYNGERYLAEAIESVIYQTYRPLEILVVDDGSTDDTASITKRFAPKVRYHFQPNRGAGAARNTGIELARGDFLAFLDADDLWVKKKLMVQIAHFADHSNLDMLFGHVKQFYSPELTKDDRDKIKIPFESMPGRHVGTMLIKRDAFMRVGPFGGNWELAEFIDWHARATELGLESLMLPDILMRRRIHKANQGVYKRQYRTDYTRVVKAALDRRRKKMNNEVK